MTIRTIRNADGILETIDDSPQISPAERKSIGAKCGHIKRRLMRNEPLAGEQLEIALNAVGDGNIPDQKELNSNDKVLISIASKLKAGQPLDEYERHLMVDVFLNTALR